MQKIEVSQGDSRFYNMLKVVEFTVLKGPSGSKNLLQRAILYRHKEILLGRDGWNFRPDETIYIYIYICTIWLVFFIDNFGLTSSFGLGSFVQRDMVRLHDWDLVRCPGKSI